MLGEDCDELCFSRGPFGFWQVYDRTLFIVGDFPLENHVKPKNVIWVFRLISSEYIPIMKRVLELNEEDVAFSPHEVQLLITNYPSLLLGIPHTSVQGMNNGIFMHNLY
jgi:hypothetical protein